MCCVEDNSCHLKEINISRNPLPPHGLLFPISSKGSFNAPTHRQDSTYHSLCYTSREWSIRRPIASWANALTTELHLAPRRESCQPQRTILAVHWIKGWVYKLLADEYSLTLADVFRLLVMSVRCMSYSLANID